MAGNRYRETRRRLLERCIWPLHVTYKLAKGIQYTLALALRGYAVVRR
jgi:hypothetical protein